jgi:hypothetical protein
MLTEDQQRVLHMDTVYEEGMGARCRHGLESAVEEYPFSTMIGAFAIGLTLGVAAGAAMASPMHSDRRRTAESVGRRVLETLQEYVPESVHQYFRT